MKANMNSSLSDEKKEKIWELKLRNILIFSCNFDYEIYVVT